MILNQLIKTHPRWVYRGRHRVNINNNSEKKLATFGSLEGLLSSEKNLDDNEFICNDDDDPLSTIESKNNKPLQIVHRERR